MLIISCNEYVYVSLGFKYSCSLRLRTRCPHGWLKYHIWYILTVGLNTTHDTEISIYGWLRYHVITLTMVTQISSLIQILTLIGARPHRYTKSLGVNSMRESYLHIGSLSELGLLLHNGLYMWVHKWLGFVFKCWNDSYIDQVCMLNTVNDVLRILKRSQLFERCDQSNMFCYTDVDVVHDYRSYQLRVRTKSLGYIILVIMIVFYLFC